LKKLAVFLEMIQDGYGLICNRSTVCERINIVHSLWLISLNCLILNPFYVVRTRCLVWVDQYLQVFITSFLNSSLNDLCNSFVTSDSVNHSVLFIGQKSVDCVIGNWMKGDLSVFSWRMLNIGHLCNHSVFEPGVDDVLSLLESWNRHRDLRSASGSSSPNILEQFLKCSFLGL